MRSKEYLRWPKYIIIPRSGVMETQLEELVSHKNIKICSDFAYMAANLNYTVDPCGNIPNICPCPWIGNTKQINAIGYEQGPVETSLKINMKISVYNGVQYDLPWSLKSHRYWSNEKVATTQEICNYKLMSSSLLHNPPKVKFHIMWIKELRSNKMRRRLITS